MWLQSYVLPLVFLLSTVSGLKEKQPINFIHVHMDVNCNGRAYSKSDLDTAASEACTRSSKQFFCRDYITPYYLKKCIPAIPRVSMYSGPHYKDQTTNGPLLKWPLPKRKVFERTRNYAIIFWNAKTRQCKVVGAIHYTDLPQHQHIVCELKKYNMATNEQFVRSSTHQRENDFRRSQTNPTEISQVENQNETPLLSQPSDTQTKSKSERFAFVHKLRQSSKIFWQKHSGNFNANGPSDSGTKGPER